jgi:hypothetical protein
MTHIRVKAESSATFQFRQSVLNAKDEKDDFEMIGLALVVLFIVGWSLGESSNFSDEHALLATYHSSHPQKTEIEGE